MIVAVKHFETNGVAWSAEQIKANSEKFSVKTFKYRLRNYIEECLNKHDMSSIIESEDAVG